MCPTLGWGAGSSQLVSPPHRSPYGAGIKNRSHLPVSTVSRLAHVGNLMKYVQCMQSSVVFSCIFLLQEHKAGRTPTLWYRKKNSAPAPHHKYKIFSHTQGPTRAPKPFISIHVLEHAGDPSHYKLREEKTRTGVRNRRAGTATLTGVGGHARVTTSRPKRRYSRCCMYLGKGAPQQLNKTPTMQRHLIPQIR